MIASDKYVPVSWDDCVSQLGTAREVAKLEPPKLAAMEAHYRTSTGVPLVIGGIPDDVSRKVNYALEIPYGLSMLVGYNPETKVVGLGDFPRDQWPNVRLVHWSFDIMVGTGFAQFPHLVTPDVTIQNAAAPESTLKLLLLALGAGAVVLLPSLIYLFQIFKAQKER